MLDSTSAKDLTWDSGCPTEVRSWSQNAEYTGTATISQTTFTTSGSLTVGSGTFVAPSGTLAVRGSLTVRNAATFSHNNGTVLLAGTGSHLLTPVNAAFNHLTIDSGLVGYWKFDEGAGLTARDSSRIGNVGSLVSGPVWTGATLHSTPGLRFYNPSALQFNDSHVDLGSSSVLNLGKANGALTISTWAYRQESPSNGFLTPLVKKASGNNAWEYVLGFLNDVGTVKVNFQMWNATSNPAPLGSTAISLNVWYHIAATRDAAGNIRLYLNGTQEGTATNAEDFTAGASATVGQGGLTFLENFQGLIDDVRLYNRALTASEVLALSRGSKSTGSGVYALGSSLDINGNLSIHAGTLDVSSANHSVNVAGNAAIHGDLTKRSGTFTLDGSGNQALSGSTVFHHLAKTVTAVSTLFLDHTGRQSASGTLTLRGTAGNLLSIRSTRAGSGARVLLDGDSGSQSIAHLDVKDSNASGGAALFCYTNTEGCIDSGNNTGWTISAETFSITGTAYADAGLTPLGAGRTVAVSLNGGAAAATDATDAGGQYTVMGLSMTGGTVLALYLDGGAEKAVTVTLGSGSSMTGVHLHTNRLIVRSDSGSVAMTNSALGTADDGGDTDIASVYTVDSGVLNVKSGKALVVWAGDGFTPGGNLNVGSGVTIDGTLTLGGNRLTLSGSWTKADAGTFAVGTSTVVFDGPAAVTLSPGTPFSGRFHNLSIEKPTGTLTLSGNPLAVSGALLLADGAFVANGQAATVTGLLTVNGGTYDAGSALHTLHGGLTVNGGTFRGSAGSVNLNGDLSLAAGSLLAPTGSFIVSGDWTKTGGTFTHSGGTVTFDGTGHQVLRTGSGAFKHLTVSKTSGSLQLSGTGADLDGDLTITSGTFGIGGYTLNLSGSLTNRAAFAGGTGSVILDGTNQTLSGSTAFYALRKTVDRASTLTFDAADTFTVSGALVLQGAASHLLSLRSSTTGTQWCLNPIGSRTIGYLDVKDGVNLNSTALSCLTGCANSGNNTNWTFPSSSSSSSAAAISGADGGGGKRGGGRGSTLRSRVLRAQETLLARYRDSLARKQPVSSAASSAENRGGVPEPSSPRGLMAIAERRGRLLVLAGGTPVLYKDVETDAWYAPYVAELVTGGIAQGYRDPQGKPTGEFGVGNPVTRAEVLKMALEAAGKSPDPQVKTSPQNRTARGTWAASYVRQAEELRLTVFRSNPDVHAPATRGEVIQTILEVTGFVIGKTPSTFTDVPADHPHSQAIALAAFDGFIEGDRGPTGQLLNRFRPDDPINRAEVAKIITLVREVTER